MKLSYVIFAAALIFGGYKFYKWFDKPSAAQIQSFAKSLSKVVCIPQVAQASENLTKSIESEFQALTKAANSEQRNVASLLQAGVEMAKATQQKMQGLSPSMHASADPIFASDGWTSAKISKILKSLGKNDLSSITISTANEAAKICADRERDKIKAAAHLVMNIYLAN